MSDATRSVTTFTFTGIEARPCHMKATPSGGNFYLRVNVSRLHTAHTARAKELTVRVRCALRRINATVPPGIVLDYDGPNLCAAHDLAAAVAILLASGTVRRRAAKAKRGVAPSFPAFVGELSMEGEVRAVRGVLAMTLAARKAGLAEIIVPEGNAHEAATVEGIRVIPVLHIAEVIEHLTGSPTGPEPQPHRPIDCSAGDYDMSDVRGARRTVEAVISAMREGKSVLLVGAPGGGKTMIARRAVSALDPLTQGEARDVAMILSAGGLLPEGPVSVCRPFRAPHHTISEAGLVGGVAWVPLRPISSSGDGKPFRPGEASLAHHGVLFLDEANEFRRSHLESCLDQIDRGRIVTRDGTIPAAPIVIAAVNPCPCGYFGTDTGRCQCSEARREAYRKRFDSIAKRFDVVIEMEPVTVASVRRGRPYGANATATADERRDHGRAMRQHGTHIDDIDSPLSDAEREGYMEENLASVGAVRNYLLGQGPTMRDGEPAEEVDADYVEDRTGLVEVGATRSPADERWYATEGTDTYRKYHD